MHIAGTLSRESLDRVNGIRRLIRDGLYETPLRLALGIEALRPDLVEKDFVPKLRLAMEEACASHDID